MSSRAQSSAGRGGAGELSAGEEPAAGERSTELASTPEATAPDEAVSREIVLPRAVNVGGEAEETLDGDEEEVVPEPDSVELAPPAEGAAAQPTAEAPEAVPEAGAPAEVTAARSASRPPPLVTELSAEDLAVSHSAFTGASEAEVEVTAAELESAEAADGGVEERRSSRPPYVDEVPDPVTPYEQRVSETLKVADLPPVEQLRGRVLANRYLAEEVAEHTACSIGYRAYHLALDRAVTVRVLLRGLSCSEEACQEVRAAAALVSELGHENVAPTLDFGVLSDGWPYLVTEAWPGTTLSTLISREGKFVLRRVLHVGKQIAFGLSAAHGAGLLHGLLSPDQVFVVEPGSSAEVVKVMGFGVARARGPVPGPPRSGVFGVPFYVSPEDAACRPLDARSDIYSLGVILYELMTGAPPFSDGDFAGVLCQHLDDDAPSPSSKLSSPGALAKALDAIIERCLRKEPERRYQTVAEVADDLVRLEAAAARTKRRPMPEVQKPMSTIHAPHRKAESVEVPEAKVIVHEDVDEVSSPEPPQASSGRRSSPVPARPAAGQPFTPPTSGRPAAAQAFAPPARSPGSRPPAVGSRPPAAPAWGPASSPPRVRMDQATIKISPEDRARFKLEQQELPASPWESFLGWVRGGPLGRLLGGGSRDR